MFVFGLALVSLRPKDVFIGHFVYSKICQKVFVGFVIKCIDDYSMSYERSGRFPTGQLSCSGPHEYSSLTLELGEGWITCGTDTLKSPAVILNIFWTQEVQLWD